MRPEGLDLSKLLGLEDHKSSNKNTFGVLVKVPFTKFARAKGKDGILTNHAANMYHKQATDTAKAFISTYQNPESRIDIKLSCEAQQLSETNRHILVQIMETILLLARQESGEDENYEDWDWDRETLIKAEGLRCSLTSGTHISALVILKNGLQPVKALNVKLQKRDSDIFKAYGHIDFVTKEVQSMRMNIDEVWDEWFIESCVIAEDVGSSIETPRTTKVQRNRANVPADTPSTYFKRAIAVPFLDSFSQGLTERFSPENRCMRSIMGLLPSVLLTNAEALDEQMQELMFWEADLPSPENAEIGSRTRFFQNMDKAQLPENFVDCLRHADEDFFPNIRMLIILGCTSPVTSCEAERSLSALRRVKTYLRSICCTMGEERLAGLTLMAIHYQATLQLSSNKVVQRFVQKLPRRLFCQSIIFN
ncbi:52 kDa repressor of the inhibitor of the protein kinase-like [Diadema antillarum]|uniref:52 kDa repressor of the inhibitor of the protein kinase-like n=1 Tax=Diadema antillarum TaxID=105358 RepID=UPI003A8618C4